MLYVFQVSVPPTRALMRDFLFRHAVVRVLEFVEFDNSLLLDIMVATTTEQVYPLKRVLL